MPTPHSPAAIRVTMPMSRQWFYSSETGYSGSQIERLNGLSMA